MTKIKIHIESYLYSKEIIRYNFAVSSIFVSKLPSLKKSLMIFFYFKNQDNENRPIKLRETQKHPVWEKSMNPCSFFVLKGVIEKIKWLLREKR